METKTVGIIVQDTRVRKPGAKRRAIMLAVFVLLLGALVSGAYFALGARHPGMVLNRYEYAIVQRKDIENLGQFSGIVDFATTITIDAPTAATVDRVLVNPGDTVHKSQLLLKLVSPELERTSAIDSIQLDRKRQAKERLILDRSLELAKNDKESVAAKGAADRTTRELEKTRLLFAAGAASKTELAAAELAQAQAASDLAELTARIGTGEKIYQLALAGTELDIAEAQARLDADRELAASLNIKSPFEGKIIQVPVRPGTPVENRAALVTVVDQSAPLVKFDIPESSIGAVARGQSVQLVIAGKTYQGSIAEIAANATGGTLTTSSSVAISAAFIGSAPSLLPGVSAEVQMRLGFREKVLVLPKGAFLTTGADRSAYVIDGERAKRVEVGYGIGNASEIEITSGLAEGQKVIISSYEDFASLESFQIAPQGGSQK